MLPDGEVRLLVTSIERECSAKVLGEGLSWPGVEGGVGLPALASA